MKKIITPILLVLGLVNTSHAQTMEESTVKPFADEQVVTDHLFNIEEQELNYHFTAELPGGNYAIIEWRHLSDWTNKGDLEHVIAIARKYYEQVQDSFKSATTAKRLDIHIPIENEPATVKILEHQPISNVVLLKGNMHAQLKVNMDTLKVLRTVGEVVGKNQTYLSQVQYTFLLKDIDQIKKVDEDKELTTDISRTFDSIVVDRRRDWNNQDKWTHNLNVSYRPTSYERSNRLVAGRVRSDNNSGRFYKAFEWDWNLGVILFRNSPCPMDEVGISYKWRNNHSQYWYVRMSEVSFPNIVWNGTLNYRSNALVFYNLEFGMLKSKAYTRIPLHQVSFGGGYSYNDPGSSYFDPTLRDDIFRAYISFSLSRVFKLTFDNYFLGDNKSFNGLTATVRLY